MANVTIKQLLEAGVHFGHQTHRWNPKMKKFIFGERNGIYIINLEITLKCLEKTLEFVRQIAAEGRDVLLIGTKKQAQISIRESSESAGMPYVNERWLGGMLTNFETVRKSIGKLESIDQMEQDGSMQFVTKKEAGRLRKEREKLVRNLTGIRNMRKLPGAVFVVDAKKEEIAIREAKKLNIPIIAVLDTNVDPTGVDYPLPGNDDAIRAVKLFCEQIAGAVREGRSAYDAKVAEEMAARQAEEEARQNERARELQDREEKSPEEGGETASEPVATGAAARGEESSGDKQGQEKQDKA